MLRGLALRLVSSFLGLGAPVNNIPDIYVHFYTQGRNETLIGAWLVALGREKKQVVGKQYLVRQAALLLKLAKSTSDPQVIAGLVEKAADLKSQVDDAADLSLQAPDVESPTL